MRRAGSVGVVLAATLVVAGCWNGGNTNVRLGDVSLGRQLMDLKAAHEAGIVDGTEYERLRTAMMDLSLACERGEDDAGS